MKLALPKKKGKTPGYGAKNGRRSRHRPFSKETVRADNQKTRIPSIPSFDGSPGFVSSAGGPGDDLAEEAVTPPVQARLKVGPAGDRFEQEAERLADKVIGRTSMHVDSARLSEFRPPRPAAGDGGVQKKDSPPGHSGGGQPGRTDAGGHTSISRDRGSPLPDGVRSDMERRFGADFGQVRIHADSRSAKMASKMKAEAFTHGRDIYFSGGKYDASSRPGRHLLAHELTHVMQQSGMSYGRFKVASAQNRGLVQRLPSILPEEWEDKRRWLERGGLGRRALGVPLAPVAGLFGGGAYGLVKGGGKTGKFFFDPQQGLMKKYHETAGKGLAGLAPKSLKMGVNWYGDLWKWTANRRKWWSKGLAGTGAVLASPLALLTGALGLGGATLAGAGAGLGYAGTGALGALGTVGAGALGAVGGALGGTLYGLGAGTAKGLGYLGKRGALGLKSLAKTTFLGTAQERAQNLNAPYREQSTAQTVAGGLDEGSGYAKYLNYLGTLGGAGTGPSMSFTEALPGKSEPGGMISTIANMFKGADPDKAMKAGMGVYGAGGVLGGISGVLKSIGGITNIVEYARTKQYGKLLRRGVGRTVEGLSDVAYGVTRAGAGFGSTAMGTAVAPLGIVSGAFDVLKGGYGAFKSQKRKKGIEALKQGFQQPSPELTDLADYAIKTQKKRRTKGILTAIGGALSATGAGLTAGGVTAAAGVPLMVLGALVSKGQTIAGYGKKGLGMLADKLRYSGLGQKILGKKDKHRIKMEINEQEQGVQGGWQAEYEDTKEMSDRDLEAHKEEVAIKKRVKYIQEHQDVTKPILAQMTNDLQNVNLDDPLAIEKLIKKV